MMVTGRAGTGPLSISDRRKGKRKEGGGLGWAGSGGDWKMEVCQGAGKKKNAARSGV
jgi:hypothetical protein